jgi:hypothetical protein
MLRFPAGSYPKCAPGYKKHYRYDVGDPVARFRTYLDIPCCAKRGGKSAGSAAVAIRVAPVIRVYTTSTFYGNRGVCVKKWQRVPERPRSMPEGTLRCSQSA